VSSILNTALSSRAWTWAPWGLPTLAAIAGSMASGREAADLKSFLARSGLRPGATRGLSLGHDLPEVRREPSPQLSGYLGLSTRYLLQANLRVDASRFRKELLRDERLVLGRYDGRSRAPTRTAAGETPGYDPSSTGITGAFVASSTTLARS